MFRPDTRPTPPAPLWLLGLMTLACGSTARDNVPPTRAATADAAASPGVSPDDPWLARLRPLRATLRQQPGALRPTLRFAAVLQTALTSGRLAPHTATSRRLVQEAERYFQAAARHHPDQAATLWTLAAELHLSRGGRTHAQELLERAMDSAPTLLAAQHLLPLYARQHKRVAVDDVCRRTRAVLTAFDTVYALFALCHQHSGERDLDKALSWASAADRAVYQAERERRLAAAGPPHRPPGDAGTDASAGTDAGSPAAAPPHDGAQRP
ncbi:MAG: hypothetical protein ACPGUV_04405 [Polyangiales bacterium]